MNLLGKGQLGALFLLLTLLACDDERYKLGVQTVDPNYKVVYKEFNLPTVSYQVDSLVTTVTGSSSVKRLLVGTANDDTFGHITAKSFVQFYPVQYVDISDAAVYDHISMTLVLDYYTFGSRENTQQTYEVYALDDSLVNSESYYSFSTTPVAARRVGVASEHISPAYLDELYNYSLDKITDDNDGIDSVRFDLIHNFGAQIFNTVRKTDSLSLVNVRPFYKWRRLFEGLAIVPAGTDKVVGFAPAHAKSRISLWYFEDGKTKHFDLTMNPTVGPIGYSNYVVDRNGTPLASIATPYENFEPADGMRYIHNGGGVLTRIDLGPVYEYFEGIHTKALNVAELSIKSDEQQFAPTEFLLRTVKPNNRTYLALTKTLDAAWDSVTVADYAKLGKHYVSISSAPRADPLGDDGQLLTLSQRENEGVSSYKGFMTNFLQREIDLPDKDYLRYLSLVSTTPDFGKSFNGYYFHKDSVKLKIFYTTPAIEE